MAENPELQTIVFALRKKGHTFPVTLLDPISLFQNERAPELIQEFLSAAAASHSVRRPRQQAPANNQPHHPNNHHNHQQNEDTDDESDEHTEDEGELVEPIHVTRGMIEALSANPCIFEYDYEAMRKEFKEMDEELARKTMHPKRVTEWIMQDCHEPCSFDI